MDGTVLGSSKVVRRVFLCIFLEDVGMGPTVAGPGPESTYRKVVPH